MLAVLTQPDRTKDLAELDLPVTVIHGLNDPLVHRSGGKATAAAIPGAEHIEIAGMAPRSARPALRHVHRRHRAHGRARRLALTVPHLRQIDLDCSADA